MIWYEKRKEDGVSSEMLLHSIWIAPEKNVLDIANFDIAVLYT